MYSRGLGSLLLPSLVLFGAGCEDGSTGAFSSPASDPTHRLAPRPCEGACAEAGCALIAGWLGRDLGSQLKETGQYRPGEDFCGLISPEFNSLRKAEPSTLKYEQEFPWILEDSKSHVCIVLGRHSFGGQAFYQVVHGIGSVFLISESELFSRDYLRVAVLDSPSDTLEVSVGEATLTVNGLFHNLGVFRDVQSAPSECRIILVNSGATALTVDVPNTSCRCTIADVAKPVVLEPGQIQTYTISASIGSERTFWQSVELTVADPVNLANRHLVFHVFGNIATLGGVYPKAINFGDVDRGSLHERKLQLEKSILGPYQIVWFSNGGMPIFSDAPSDGNNIEPTQREFVTLYLAPHSDEPIGEVEGHVIFRTNSDAVREFSVPVSYSVRKPYAVTPSTANFGAVPVGVSKQVQVVIESRNGGALKARLGAVPHDVSAEITQLRDDAVSVLIGTQRTDSGVWSSGFSICMSVNSEDYCYEMRCSGLATGEDRPP